MDEARLQGIPLFAGLGKSERRLVARCADEVELEPGDSLCREGELAWEFLVIEEGTAKVVRGDQYLNELGPGDFLGEMGLIEGSARNATVTALSPIRAIVMTGHAFRQICREMPQVGRRIRAAIEERHHWLEPVT
jgi:CRP-like cAMP-binding protein